MCAAAIEVSAETDRYLLTLAKSPEELRSAQRLRYEVFNLEMKEGLAESARTGLDADEFDAVCDHLLVRERGSGLVVGTYRMQTGTMAVASGLGYYSAREFDFAPFEKHRAEIVELGRACVAADHRNQSVLGLLWRGISLAAQARDARYLIGCSSLTSQNPLEGLVAYRLLAGAHLAPPAWRTTPLPALRCGNLDADSEPDILPVKIPRLMSGYLAVGAKICGEPALDRDFGTIDFLTWMDLQSLPVRVMRKFMS